MPGIWDELHFLFDTDDGSLSEIAIQGLSGDAVASMYAFIRSHSKVAHPATFWHKALDREERLDSWPNAALLVTTGEAEVFHFVASDIAFHGETIPPIGVFVFPDEIALDYRMGPDWNKNRILALFELLRQLTKLNPGCSIRLEPWWERTVEERFVAAWSDLPTSEGFTVSRKA